MSRNVYLESKARYEVLDGLRGVAALCVVLYHMVECYSAKFTGVFMTHGYMAVDFFFALSGYVIGYAYDDRWDRMSLGGFFKRRLTRLHPMVIMGAFIGLAFFYYSGSCELFGLVDSTPWWLLLVEVLLTVLMIPLPPSMDIRGWGELSSINGPIWTLMYEYVANFLYAVFFRFLPVWGLAIFACGAAVITADLTLGLDLFGLADPSYAYSVIGGFVFTPQHVYIGFARLLYPFLIGLIMSRIGKTIKLRRGFLVTSLIVLAMLAMPQLGGDAKIVDGAYQLFCIVLVFPLILLMGAGSEPKGKGASRVCKFLGEISFPLYITHYPVIYMHTSWAQRHPDLPLGTHIVVAVTTLLLVIGIAYACLKLYDEPVRAWLKEHWLKKSSHNSDKNAIFTCDKQ